MVSLVWILSTGLMNTKPSTETRRNVLKLMIGLPLLGHASANAQTPQGRVFGSDAGMILNMIKPEKAGDFEMVVEKVKAALHGRHEAPLQFSSRKYASICSFQSSAAGRPFLS